MIEIASTALSSSAGAASAASQKSNLDYESFLKLLVTTMKNQDPTKPNDPAQTLAQLASFSVVEQGIKTNSKLDALMSAAAGGQAGALIGKVVRSEDGLTSGTVVSVEIGSKGLRAQIADGRWVEITSGVLVSAP
jgi:flagellar basal-body rod modification protein FlgD